MSKELEAKRQEMLQINYGVMYRLLQETYFLVDKEDQDHLQAMLIRVQQLRLKKEKESVAA